MLHQFRLLFKIEMSSWKDSWVWSIGMISIFPLITLSFLHFIIPGLKGNESIKVITGSMVFPIILMGMNTYAINISASKEKGEFDYYAGLPITKALFLLSKLTSGFFMTLPSVFIAALFGQWLFKVSLSFNLVSILILFLSVGCCVSFGVFLGLSSKNHNVTNVISQIFMMFVSFLSPVMIEENQLPFILRKIATILPTTYVANLFNYTFRGEISGSFWKDISILMLFFIVFLVSTSLLMDWRKS